MSIFPSIPAAIQSLLNKHFIEYHEFIQALNSNQLYLIASNISNTVVEPTNNQDKGHFIANESYCFYLGNNEGKIYQLDYTLTEKNGIREFKTSHYMDYCILDNPEKIIAQRDESSYQFRMKEYLSFAQYHQLQEKLTASSGQGRKKI